MRKKILLLISPILGMCILTLGNGFFTTLSTVQLNNIGYSAWIIGIISSVYFLGMTLGPYFSQSLIARVGFIRSYVIFAAILSISTLLLGVFNNPILWMILRFICGYALAGLFVVIESWCLCAAGSKNKGTVFSFYLFAYYGAQSVSQLFLNIHFSEVIVAFCLVSVLASFSIIIVSITRVDAPIPEYEGSTPPWRILNKIPLSIWTAFVGGVILGSIYTIYPLFLQDVGLVNNRLSYIMMITLLGGMLFQIPIGKLSDIIDRRVVLFFVLLIFIIVSALILLIHEFYWELLIGSFILGGMSFVLYPLSISHASDYVAENQIINVIGTLTISYGLGSMIGPLVISVLIEILGPYGYFILMLVIAISLASYTIYRIIVGRKIENDDKVCFTSTTAEVMGGGVSDSNIAVEQNLVSNEMNV
jgi:MFS family permease